jgi:hypothetical protein
MKKYDCKYERNGMFAGMFDYGQSVEAENAEDALRIFTKLFPNEEHPTVRIECRWAIFGAKFFTNPNYNPNYIEPKKAEVEETYSEQPERSGKDSEWLESLGKVAKKIRNQAVPPESSGWATLYRVCGWIGIIVGGTGFIVITQGDVAGEENVEAGFIFAVWAILPALTSFLFAFLIDVLTDMRHYLKRIAEKS